MSDVDLGKLITSEQHRDAVHVAIAPVVANEILAPGQHVGFLSGGDGRVGALATTRIGIVDPFIVGFVPKDAKFFLFLYPKTVTGMRHHWSHPAFSDAASVASATQASKDWLTRYAASVGVDYDELIDRAKAYQMSGEYWSEGGRFEGEYVPNEFWDHYQNATGNTVGSDRGNFFSCSC